jgi:hypothetical protein
MLTSLSEDVTLPTAKGGSHHEQRPSMLLRAYMFLTSMLALLLSRRSLSRGGLLARGQFSQLNVKLVHYAVHLEPFHVGNSPVAAKSCEHMSLH